jgi:hypothetical protein
MAREIVKSIEDVEKELAEKENQVDKRTEEKEFVINREDEGLYSIGYTAGGEVPDVLKGKWTNIRIAEAAIKDYKRIQAEKEASK